jgi:hypothetical protein
MMVPQQQWVAERVTETVGSCVDVCNVGLFWWISMRAGLWFVIVEMCAKLNGKSVASPVSGRPQDYGGKWFRGIALLGKLREWPMWFRKVNMI